MLGQHTLKVFPISKTHKAQYSLFTARILQQGELYALELYMSSMESSGWGSGSIVHFQFSILN